MRFLNALWILLLLQGCTEEKKDITPQYEQVKKNYAENQLLIEKEYDNVSTEEAKELLFEKEMNLKYSYVDSLNHFISTYPNEAFIGEAWVEVFNAIWYEREEKYKTLFNQAIKVLATKYAASEVMEELNSQTIKMAWIDPEIETLAQTVIAKNKSDVVNDRFTLAYADRLIHKEDRTKAELDQSISLFNSLLTKYADVDPESDHPKAHYVQESKKFLRVFHDLAIGKKAPETISKDLEGNEERLSDYKGKVVMIDVWATWCAPCIKMIPDITTLAASYPDKSVEIISVSADNGVDIVKKFQEKTPMPWNHWFDGTEGAFLDQWGVFAFPTVLVIDKEGIIRHRFDGGIEDHEALKQALDQLI